MKKLLFFLLFFMVMLPFGAAAQQWQIDQAHTNFYFDVRHTYAVVRGQFTDYTAEVVFDPANPEKSRFDFVIKVDSVDTNIGKRDIHLRSPDFFDAGKYPLMTFKSNRVSAAGENRFLVDGLLTIKDVSKGLTIEFVYHGQKNNPIKAGQVVAGLDAKLTIDRLEYNVGNGKFYNLGVVDKDVNIHITMELLR